jgi:hypothetical protein
MYSDLLSAAALLMGAAGAVFGLWQPRINEALGITKAPHPDSEERQQQAVRVRSMAWRAAFLMVSSWLLVAIFVPPAADIAVAAIHAAARNAPAFWRGYDATRAALLAVVIVGVVIAVATTRSFRLVRQKQKELSGS